MNITQSLAEAARTDHRQWHGNCVGQSYSGLHFHCPMTKLSKTFTRNDDGSWTCIALASLNGPNGRIQVAPGTTFAPGEKFMGVELVAWLEKECAAEGKNSD